MKPVYEIDVGDEAPPFRLPSHLDREISLQEYRGERAVVLAFHPLCYTPVCTDEVRALQRQRQEFAAAGAEILVLSVDSIPAKKAWADELGGVEIPMLADFWPHGHVAARYGILRGEGISERAVFVVDRGGKVAWKKVYGLGETPDTGEVLAAVRALG